MAETLEEKIQRVLREDVSISRYHHGWPEMFRQEKEHLLKCLPSGLIRRIEHYGSTAVPGLAAKPIIDMLVEVTNLDETKAKVAPILEAQGYDYFWRPTWGDDVPPSYAWFIKRDSGTGARTHHIHMITGSPEFAPHWDALLFRDYLIEHPEVASEYEQLKRRLAETHPNDRVVYTSGSGICEPRNDTSKTAAEAITPRSGSDDDKGESVSCRSIAVGYHSVSDT